MGLLDCRNVDDNYCQKQTQVNLAVKSTKNANNVQNAQVKMRVHVNEMVKMALVFLVVPHSFIYARFLAMNKAVAA